MSQQALVHFGLVLNGDLLASGGSYYNPENDATQGHAYANYYLDVLNFPQRHGLYGSHGVFDGDLLGLVFYDTWVTLGSPFDLSVSLLVEANVYAWDQAASADANFSNTLTWAGVSVTLEGGGPVDYSVSSESGFDYRQALVQSVPEPTSLLLLGSWLAGLGGISLIRHRRK